MSDRQDDSRSPAPSPTTTAPPQVRVALDMTLASQIPTGVGVYARTLADHLGIPPIEVLRWRQDLGPRGHAAQRLRRALRLTRWLLVRLPRAARRDGIDVCHSPTSVGPLRTPCPRVMTVHDAVALTIPSQHGLAERLYFRLFSVIAARRADAVLVPSRAAREEIARAYRIPPARLVVIPSAAAPRFRPVLPGARAAVLRRYGIRPPYVLHVGAAAPRKNLPRLLDAYATARRAAGGDDTQLVLVGPPGPTAPARWLRTRRLELDPHVRRLDAVPDDDLPALYSGAACLAYPSLAEGFGLPILEAMACGTPVLTSGCSSMQEVAGEAALLVDPARTETIAEGLVRLLTEDRLREELIARGLARAGAFTWARTARATEAVYLAVAGRGPSNGETRDPGSHPVP
jgi:glycosyltransferase involved in cell wall biosynthesis